MARQPAGSRPLGQGGDQWRMGFNGPVALDLIPVFRELDRMELEREDYDSLLADVRIMAAAAMGEMRAE
ncbi:hypothetical protein GCM10010975_13420 [Comamonas phosphati]|nr:hypothetical protein GCM10010975_13420 [Comamonas phosphati]